MSPGPQQAVAGEPLSFGRIAVSLLLAAVAAACCYWFLAGPAGTLLDLGTLRRYPFVREFYRNYEPAGGRQVVIGLGDSVTMSGFNGEAFEEQAGAGWAAYNLATPAKAYPEYLFDLAEPALDQVELVVFVTPAALYDPEYARLDPRKAQLNLVLGARVDRPVWEAYAAAVPDSGAEAALVPLSQAVLASRWRVEESLAWRAKLLNPGERGSQAVRNLLGEFSSNMKYPSWDGYAGEQELAAEMEVIRRGFPRLDSGDTAPDPDNLRALEFVLSEAGSTCSGVTLVIAPVHSRVRGLMGEERFHRFRETVEQLEGVLGADQPAVVDLSEFLEDADFRDYVHINNRASVKVTRRIAQSVLERRGGGG